ncbi:STAS/SEC14 domain-containing protein [Micavibrio aeruginosavorus]|uniref:STAS/SEC14 domain-containing protein n=1 Tax=Micavibrio aeruginosavorus TaxID=349221 RepID=UPI003F4AC0D5
MDRTQFNEIMPETDDRVICIRVDKPISGEGYKTLFLPLVQKMAADHGEIRMVLVFEKFQGWEEEAAMADLASTMFLAQHLKKLAIVNLPDKMIQYIGMRQAALKTDLRIFDASQFQDALNWARI